MRHSPYGMKLQTLLYGMQTNNTARIPIRVKERDQGAFDLPLDALPIYKREAVFLLLSPSRLDQNTTR